MSIANRKCTQPFCVDFENLFPCVIKVAELPKNQIDALQSSAHQI